jgi:hypothetical protein
VTKFGHACEGQFHVRNNSSPENLTKY